MIWKKDYSDIVDLPHHVSKVHKKMPVSDRAAQFSPFAALTGHDEAVKETARFVDEKKELDDSQKIEINDQLNFIKDHLNEYVRATLVYFQKDMKKEGGTYMKITDRVKKIDEYKGCLCLENGYEIMFDDLYSINNVEIGNER